MFKKPNLEYTIYTKKECVYCDNIKKFLSEKGKEFTSISCDDFLKENKELFLQEMDKLTSPSIHRTFPFVFHGTKFVGGCDDTKIYVESKDLTEEDFNDDNF
jgi:glutaredoxin